MDGNGRWARHRSLPRAAGHEAGVEALRTVVRHAARSGVGALTVYVFSSENWQRPDTEVSTLVRLFIRALNVNLDELFNNNVRVSFIGDLSVFPGSLQTLTRRAVARTSSNGGLELVVALNYGGRQEIVAACKRLCAALQAQGQDCDAVSEEALSSHLDLQSCPDLLIRTGGELRVSNFLLWQLAYTELYFTDVYWPDFDTAEFDKALAWYAGRQRRFGRTSEQLSDGNKRSGDDNKRSGEICGLE